MLRLSAIPMMFMFACSTTGSFSGTLVDGLSGQPVSGVRLLAKAPQALDMSCQVFEATSAADGSFVFDKTCGDTRYTIESTDETLLLGDMQPFDGGLVPTAPTQVKAYKGTKGNGVNTLIAGEIKRVPTSSDIKKKTILDTEEEVLYPVSLPTKVVRIKPGDYLLIAGEGSIKKLGFSPLIQDENKRRFGTHKEWTTLEPWWYVGVKFSSDTEFERVTATLDPSKVTDVTAQGQQLHYIDGAALTAGRYALMGKHDRRMYILDFGPE